MVDLPIRPYADFYPLVFPFVPMVSSPMMDQALRLSAAEFCERTRCWRHITTRRVIRSEVNLVCPPYATIFEIENATFDGIRLEPTQFTNVEQGQPDGSGVGQPSYITQSNPQAVSLIPFGEPGELVLSLFLKPMAGVDQPLGSSYEAGFDDAFNVVPQFMLMQFGEAIAAGALRRILSVPNQPWTNPQDAAMYEARFERACDNSFRHQMRGQQRAPSRARATYF